MILIRENEPDKENRLGSGGEVWSDVLAVFFLCGADFKRAEQVKFLRLKILNLLGVDDDLVCLEL